MTEEQDATSREVRCREALTHIYTFLDGELTPEVCDQISVHLEACSPCAHAFGFETEIKALVARCCCEPAPDGLRDRIAAALGLA